MVVAVAVVIAVQDLVVVVGWVVASAYAGKDFVQRTKRAPKFSIFETRRIQCPVAVPVVVVVAEAVVSVVEDVVVVIWMAAAA